MRIPRIIRHSAVAQTAKRLLMQLSYGSCDVFQSRAHVGNDRIATAIKSGEPAAMGKLGSTELQTVCAYLKTRHAPDRDTKTAVHRRTLLEFSGVFPDTYDTYARWGETWVNEVMPAMTGFGVWFNLHERWLIRTYAPQAHVFHSYGLEPYIFENPWSAHLAGKRVVVVSPFSKTIMLQYPKRAAIWARRPSVLPDFDLRTVQSPTYPHLAKPVFSDWFAALDDMKRRIQEREFDVLLVGAGAYSLPLCVFAKSLGKVGIHLGGNMQLMFGILGKRWLVPNASIDHRYFNDAWIYPLTEETPEGCAKIENACYWK